MHAFLHFVVSLQRRFYTLALTSDFDDYIYLSRLKLFRIGPRVVRRQSNSDPSAVFHSTVALTVTLALSYI